MLVGPAAEGGGFATFPFYKLARLSDEPSAMTGERAADILRRLGLSEDKVQAVLLLSVKHAPSSLPHVHPQCPGFPTMRIFFQLYRV